MVHLDEGLPCTIGRNVTIGHACVLHGCSIEDEVLVGMGAIILNKAVIGRGSVVGAGALVLEGMQVPPFSLVVGSPAKAPGSFLLRVAQEFSCPDDEQTWVDKLGAS